MTDVYSNEHARCSVVIPAALPKHMQERIREVTGFKTAPEFQRQGFGTQLMQQVCEDADLNNIVLMLNPSPEANSITKDKLMAWYKRFGFVKAQDDPVLMARAPTFKVRQSMVGAAVEKALRG